MQFDLSQLNKFFGQASLAAYAGGGTQVKAWSPGFNELEYRDDDWYYRDSYVGFFKSFGREVVWHQDKPVWTQHYGGGMEPEYKQDVDFTKRTFEFLKQALSAGNKTEHFQPRGPKEYAQGSWKYKAGFTGNMAKFTGSEEVLFKNKLVFTHHYFGGVVVDKE